MPPAAIAASADAAPDDTAPRARCDPRSTSPREHRPMLRDDGRAISHAGTRVDPDAPPRGGPQRSVRE